jgi:hypothetical protein
LEAVLSFNGAKEEIYNNINNKFFEIYEWQVRAIGIVNNAPWAARYALYLYNKTEYRGFPKTSVLGKQP